MKTILIIVGIAILVGAGIFLVSRISAPVGDVSALEFRDYEGNAVTLDSFEGPMVVNSWAVWCPFCKEELKDFARVQEEFEGQVTIIAIDRAEPLSQAKGFTDSIGVTDTLVFLLDPSDSFYKSIGGFSMPETLFINAAGEVVIHKRGPMREQEIRDNVQKIL